MAEYWLHALNLPAQLTAGQIQISNHRAEFRASQRNQNITPLIKVSLVCTVPPVFSSSHLSFLLLFFQKELFLLKRAPTKSFKKVGRPRESNPGLPDKKCRIK